MKLGHKTSDFSPRFRHPTSNCGGFDGSQLETTAANR